MELKQNQKQNIEPLRYQEHEAGRRTSFLQEEAEQAEKSISQRTILCFLCFLLFNTFFVFFVSLWLNS
jgi:hypothetical protein